MDPHLYSAIVTDPACREHRVPLDHPESTARLDAVLRGLDRAGILNLIERIPSRMATVDELLLCHTPEYVELVRREVEAGAVQLSTGDTFVCRETWKAALAAAGCCLSAVDAVFERRARNVFCAVRPPGHHAEAGAGMGFCVFNNAALAARYAQRKHGARRVLIADWDVHHGNGTQNIFYGDDSVFYFSVHQSPLYPGTGARSDTGEGRGVGTTLNVPVPGGAGGGEILAAFNEELLPAMRDFRPDFVVVSAGFDARVDDPLGGLEVTDDDFAELTQLVLGIAKDHAGGRLISVMEGGYDLSGLASAVVRHVQTMADHG